jgi:ubiquinone/menaquinone biosynthesis C-methylase UbiE
MELPLNVEIAVLGRYSAASKAVQPALCCPVSYDRKLLAVLPDELIERDYGCGDPSRFVREGEAVLDLGSGGGKICYIASQIVGPKGRVVGIDMNEDMLALARKHQREIASRIGWDNVTFYRGRIQDLTRSLDEPDSKEPLIPSSSIDVVLSNCVLNLVSEADREQLFREVFRVLRSGGRAVISDIVSSRAVPAELKADPTLWSGCISGAFEEQAFLQAFTAAGFSQVQIAARQEEPWTVVEGIEFRSVTVQAVKGEGLPSASCCDSETCC